MLNELIPMEKINALEVFGENNGLDPIIEKIKERARSEVLDVTTKEGRQQIGSLAKKIGSSKKRLEEMAMALTEDWRQKTKYVNAERNRMVAELDSLRDEIKAPLDEFNHREKTRIQGHQGRLEAMRNTANFEGFAAPDSDELRESIKTLKKLYKVDIDNTPVDWEEFSEKGRELFEIINERLEGMLNERLKYEAEQDELDRLRKEEAERKKRDYEEKLKSEAAEKARKEAEEKAEREKREAEKAAKAAEAALIAAKEQAKRDKEEAERKAKEAADRAEREKQEAVEAERKRVAEEQRKKQEAEAKRQADLCHKKEIQNAIYGALQSIQEKHPAHRWAEQLVEELDKGNIPHIKIQY